MSLYKLSTCPAMADLLAVVDAYIAAVLAGDDETAERLTLKAGALNAEIDQRRNIFEASRGGA